MMLVVAICPVITIIIPRIGISDCAAIAAVIRVMDFVVRVPWVRF